MENVITAFYSDSNLYHFSFTSKILKLNGYDLLRSFSFLHPTQFYESSFLIHRLLTMTLVYSLIIVLSFNSHINICLIELLLRVDKQTSHCNLPEFWKIRFTFLLYCSLTKVLWILLQCIFLFLSCDNYFELTIIYDACSSSSLNLVLLKFIESKISTIWI